MTLPSQPSIELPLLLELERAGGSVRIVNRFPRGIYITTSSFTPGAQEEADEPGPPQVVLVDGDRLVDIMLEKGLGVRTVPVTKQEVAEEFFTSF